MSGSDLAGRVAVVTGATTGMGLATAEALAARGAQVVLTGRDPGRLRDAVSRVQQVSSGERGAHGLLADLADLASVHAGAEQLMSQVDRIDLLINNAGVMFTPFGHTVDGHELQFGTNHLGHFAFTLALEPLLRQGGARIVNLTSAGHKIAEPDLEDPDWQHRTYDKFAAYGASKTANIWFSSELDRRWLDDGVRAFAVHPGNVATDLARHMDRADFKAMATMSAARPGAPQRMSFATPAEGAATAIWAATAPELAGRGGLYLADCAVSEDVAAWACDTAKAQALWSLSEQMVAQRR
ncbi:SDR family NAD(P)-dependent oxidoreductase [Nocardioides dubius]|uniref:SDR family NAD(P)-dependent oxidoreductase n=1 Tax=Nocardioides dubius TaxID=317019 RepID=A0ABN1TYC0_9ACTN